jgi:hypothetical protein
LTTLYMMLRLMFQQNHHHIYLRNTDDCDGYNDNSDSDSPLPFAFDSVHPGYSRANLKKEK